MFNIFIDGLLTELSKAEAGLRVGENKYNSLAYADDVTLFSSSVTGLQDLIQICSDYTDKWRFKYGIAKSKCLIAGKSSLKYDVNWFLNGKQLCTVDHLEILGVAVTFKCGFEPILS